jgi:methyl-accepting chemotaxis protein
MNSSEVKKVNSLSFKLTSILLIISIPPVILLAVLFYMRSSAILLNRIKQGFQQSAISQSQYMDQWISDRLDNMVVVAGTARVRSMDVNSVSDADQQYFDQWGTFSSMGVYTPDGAPLFRTDGSTENIGNSEYFIKAAGGENVISDPFILPGKNEVGVVFAAPIVEKNAVVGVQTGTVTLSFFESLLSEMAQGSTGEAYLIGKDGKVLTSLKFADQLVSSGTISQNPELEFTVGSVGAQKVLQGEKGSTEYLNYINKMVVGAYAPISSTGWGFLVEQQVSEATAEILALRNLVFIVAFLLMIAVLVLGLLTTRSITVPLQKLAYSATLLARGNTSVNMDEKVASKIRGQKDEIGNIGRAFDEVIAYLKRMGEAANNIAQNDLSVDVIPNSADDTLGVAFSQMIASLRRTVGTLTENANSLETAAKMLATAANQSGMAINQIAITVQQVAKGTTDQTASITRTASAVEQMMTVINSVAQGAQEQSKSIESASDITDQIDTTIQQVAGNAASVTLESEKATEAANKGSMTVEQTLQGMQEIKQKVDISAKKVQEMGARSEEIGKIVQTIQDIATQTNLLSLNAAIEAARAREEGKGFAVVAEEIRKLAERSTLATKEIGGLVGGIQSTVSEAVLAMDEGTRQVELGVTSANQAGIALNEILSAAQAVNMQANLASEASAKMRAASEQLVTAVNSVSTVVEENTSSTEEMSKYSKEVSMAIESIASVSEENSAAIEEVSASTEEMSAQVEEVSASARDLEGMAASLRSLVAQFKIER